MDLVSSTLDKYLKHRFNGSGLNREANATNETQQTESDNTGMIVSNLLTKNNSTIPDILSLNTTQTDSTIFSATTTTNHLQASPSNQATFRTTNLGSQTNFNNDKSTETMKYSNSSEPCPSDNDDKQVQSIRGEEINNSVNACMKLSNGINNVDRELPKIHSISFKNNQPCCVTLRDDLRFLAAGFDNSQIYLWTLNVDDDSKITIRTKTPLLAHSGSIYGIEFVNNNDLMLSCSEDTTIRLWCLETKCNLKVYRGHNYPIWSIAMSPQGIMFASASMDTTAKLWRLDRIGPLRIFCGHDEDVECVRFHPNEKYIATGSSDATVRLWSTNDGKMVRLMVGHKNPIISLSFLPNGKFLASASNDGAIKVWNLATNCPSSELNAPLSYNISFSPEQNFVASCGMDNILHLWQADNENLIEKRELDFGTKSTKLIKSQFHRDNKLFVIGFAADIETKKT